MLSKFNLFSRQDAKAQRSALCHFDRREKSFLDPSRSLGMMGFGSSLGAFASLRESSFSDYVIKN
jgi:hypothetical protein